MTTYNIRPQLYSEIVSLLNYFNGVTRANIEHDISNGYIERNHKVLSTDIWLDFVEFVKCETNIDVYEIDIKLESLMYIFVVLSSKFSVLYQKGVFTKTNNLINNNYVIKPSTGIHTNNPNNPNNKRYVYKQATGIYASIPSQYMDQPFEIIEKNFKGNNNISLIQFEDGVYHILNNDCIEEYTIKNEIRDFLISHNMNTDNQYIEMCEYFVKNNLLKIK